MSETSPDQELEQARLLVMELDILSLRGVDAIYHVYNKTGWSSTRCLIWVEVAAKKYPDSFLYKDLFVR